MTTGAATGHGVPSSKRGGPGVQTVGVFPCHT